MNWRDVPHRFRRPSRLGLTLGLVLGVLCPAARAGDVPAPTTAPDDSIYLKASTMGAVVVRPAATLRRLGSEQMAPLAHFWTEASTGQLARWLEVDPTQPGFRRVEAADIEAITLGLWVKKTKAKAGIPAGEKPNSFTGGDTGCVVRAVVATNWLAVLEQWGVEVQEIRGCHAPYYRLKLPALLGPTIPFDAYLPDDRTVVIIDSEGWLKPIVTGSEPEAPGFLRGADWREASRGLAAVALNNQDGAILKFLSEIWEGDGLIVGTAFMGVERWVASVADTEEIAVRAEATTRSPLTAGVFSWGLSKLVDMARTEIRPRPPVDPAISRAAAHLRDDDHTETAQLIRLEAKVDQIPTDALARLKVEVIGPAVRVGSAGFATAAEVGRMLLLLFADELAPGKPAQVLPKPPTPPER